MWPVALDEYMIPIDIGVSWLKGQIQDQAFCWGKEGIHCTCFTNISCCLVKYMLLKSLGLNE